MFFSEETQVRKIAVAYYRHSAEDKQENSVEIQRDHTNTFAAEHNMEIIHEEADEGKTGLTENRPAFKRLFDDWITNPNAPKFDHVLVYDSSRWGRFQDIDEAPYFEQICKRNGHRVIYVTRGFPDEKNKMMFHLQSSVERVMNAEYSRQLSEKVFYGSAKVSQQGFSAGGTASYGMTRLLLDEEKRPIRVLKRGERKVIANQRVTFAPCNDETTECVKRIFHDLVFRWKEPDEIAADLNHDDLRSPAGGSWTKDKILRILMNETYTGTRIYNKTWNRLKQGRRDNPKNEWIFCYDAFSALIEPDVFKEAQERLYLLMPYKRNFGVSLQRKIQLDIRKELQHSLVNQGYDTDSSSVLSQKLPLISSITFYTSDAPTEKWIFMIPESFKRYEFVVALGIDLSKEKPMRDVFMFPTSLFGSTNLLVVKNGDEYYSQYLVRKDKIEEKVTTLINEVKSKCNYGVCSTFFATGKLVKTRLD